MTTRYRREFGWQGWLGVTVALVAAAALGATHGCSDTGAPPQTTSGGDTGGMGAGGMAAGGMGGVGAGGMGAGGMGAGGMGASGMGVGYDPARGADDDPNAPNPYGGNIYYLATDGSDGNDGLSVATPWASFQHANTQVAAGDLVYVRGGTYHQYVVIGGVGSNPSGYALGTNAAPITWRSYPGEIAVLDGTGGSVVTAVLRLYGVHWNIVQNLEVRNSLAAGVAVGQGSTDNTLDNLWTHDHEGSGVGMSDSHRTGIVHVTSEDNFDVVTLGENADGFAASSGGDNELWYCVARHNSDDGFDFWESTGNVARGCVASENGYGTDGNGNGFKLGGATAGGGNLLENCVAYDNLHCGFTSNTASGNTPNTLHNCTAYNTIADDGRNFRMYGEAHVLRNNLEYGAAHPVQMEAIVDHEFNSWNLALTLNDNDFVSLDPLDLQTTFLRLAPGSPAIDAGTDVGLPFAGTAPDLGAFETP